MCGILGSINYEIGSHQLDLLGHRGPNDFGIEQFKAGPHEIFLGHRRLSILDLSSAGHQPMYSPDNKYCLIFNGEIYNHKELRRKLSPSIRFNGHSDTESILHCLIQKGINVVAEFNGIFSFCFLDLAKKRIIVARDFFGVKPLYYYINQKEFIVSSEIRPINAIIKNKDVDLDSLATLLRLRFSPSPQTLFKGIKKIKPGHILEVDFNLPNLHSKSYPILELPISLIKKKSTQSVDEYGCSLKAAVKRQLLSDVEIGIFLSGGIDSALIASLAKDCYQGQLKAYTIGFEGQNEEDEIQDAAETADFLGLKHIYRRIRFEDFIEKINECTKIVEEPLGTTSIIPMYFLAELASKDVNVVLTGQGADEPLGGYNKYKIELLQKLMPRSFSGFGSSIVKTIGLKNETVLRGFKSYGVRDEIKRFLSICELFSLSEIEQLIGIKEVSSLKEISYFYNLLRNKNLSSSVERMMALDTKFNLADDLLNYTDKISMHFSIECRVPMLDIELVKYIESLPRSKKN